MLSDDGRPDEHQLRHLVAEARADPAITTVRTSALFPTAAIRFAALGFRGVSTLVLLRADLAGDVGPRGERPATRDDAPWVTRSARRREFARLAEIDADAFGREWSHDADDLTQICSATPAHRVRVRCARTAWGWAPRRELAGFAVIGATKVHGYLQRLSVVPGQHRRGHGAALTVDALQWMRRRRLRDCLVNTGVDNVAALELYTGLGFRRLDEVLEVLELDVSTATTTADS